MTPLRVAVLDYEAGNLRSAAKAFERAGARAAITSRLADAQTADLVVVPGVGHFGQCTAHFREAGWVQPLRERIAAGRPVLGICIGMQILYPSSDEAPDAEGLGLLPGHVARLPRDVTVPHMGWDVVVAVRPDRLLDGVDGERCYFANSYYARPADDDHVVASCAYGPGFPCVVRTGSVVGVQFHPEKSADVGARFLTNLLRDVAAGALDATAEPAASRTAP